MIGNGTNWVESTPTFPNASATSRKMIVSDGTDWIASTETYAVPGASGNLLVSDGTNWTSTLPTFNQNTTGSAAKWTTARTLAGNSVDGSANVAFTNGFIVQGTSDAGLTNAQFLGSLSTGLVKNTTTTGVLSIATSGTDYSEGTSALATGILKSTTGTGALTIAVAGDFPTLNQNTTGTALNVSGTVAVANGGTGLNTFGGTNTLLYTSTANNLNSFVTANNGILITSPGGVPSIGNTVGAALTMPSINLSASSNQLVMQSAGQAGTLTWTPTVARTITFPDASGTVALANLGANWFVGGNATAGTAVLGTTDNSGINIQSGTGTINLGADAFAKTITIGNTTDPTAVNINTGTGNFAVNTSQLFVNKSNGFIGFGTTAPASPHHMVFDGTANQNILMDTYSDGGNSTLIGRKARGSMAVPTAVQANDVLMTFGASGYGDNAFSSETKAAVKFYASETWTNAAQGTYFTFITTPNGLTTRAERLRIDNAGRVGIGTPTPAALLHLAAGTATVNTAPLKFTSGTNLLSPEDGAVEYDGTNYYGTITSGPTRKTFAFLENPTFTTPNIGVATGTSLNISGTLTTGANGGTTGAINLNGATSGTVTIQPQATAGTYNFNLPTGAGTSGQPLLSAGGAGNAMTFGTLGVSAGGTGLTSAGTAGNVLRSDGTDFVSSATATNQVNGLNPASITSTSQQLLQLNGTTGVTITPSKSGKVLVILTGDGIAPSGNSNVYSQLYFNTTYASAHGVATTGFTPLGSNTIVAYNNQDRAFSLSSVVTGLTIGQTYYFDLAIYSDANTASISRISVSIVEL
jgi:hypothetical protein